MRLYELVREHDISGVSGVGIVAQAVEFASGKTVVAWLDDRGARVASVSVFDSVDDAERIHGHGGATRFVLIGNFGSV